MAAKTLSIAEVIDSIPFTPYQVLIGVLCFLGMIMEGFDYNIIAITLPRVAAYLHVKPQMLAVAMSLGLFGSLIGGALLGMLADRLGRKRILVLSAFFFGLFMLLCTTVTNRWQLAGFLLGGGFFLGGAVPSAIALAGEYTPARARAFVTTLMYAAIPGGAAVGAISSMFLLPHYGWKGAFDVASLSMVLAVVMIFLLPESPGMLLRRKDGQEKVRAILARIAPAVTGQEGIEFRPGEQRRLGVLPVKHLFQENRTTRTVLIWISFFLAYYLIWILSAWVTTLFKSLGASVQQYSLIYAAIMVASAIGTPVYGWFMDRAENPFRIVQVTYLLAFVSLFCFGWFATSSFPVILFFSLACGVFVLASGGSLVGIVTISYPEEITGSAVGWAYSCARIGMIFAPLAGGFMIGLKFTAFGIFSGNSVFCLVITALLLLLSAHLAKIGQLKGFSRKADGSSAEAVMAD